MDRNSIGGNFADSYTTGGYSEEDVRAYARSVDSRSSALKDKAVKALQIKWGDRIENKSDLAQYQSEQKAVKGVVDFVASSAPGLKNTIEKGVPLFESNDTAYAKMGSLEKTLDDLEKALNASKVFDLGFKPSIQGTLPGAKTATDTKTTDTKTTTTTTKSTQVAVAPDGDPTVAQNQRMLEKAGFSLAPYGADGKLGATTTKQVKAFQQKVGLPVTGTFDAATVAKLKSMYGDSSSDSPSAMGAVFSASNLKKAGLVLAGVAVVGGVYYVMTSED